MMRDPFWQWAKPLRQFVHSFEMAPDSGYWHFHAVTPERWDVNEIRAVSNEHGFGRIHVKEIPVSEVKYLAKYVAKPNAQMPRGARKWACHGFKGIRAADVVVTNKVAFDTLPDTHAVGLWDGWEWRCPDNQTITVLTRADADPFFPRLKVMDLKPFAVKEILAAIAQGKVVAVGEYRGFQVRTQKVANKTTYQFEERAIVEHTVEFGASSVKISEWLPTGADAKSVKAPANKGELVFCVITEISRQYGYKTESIKPVSALV